MIYPLIGQSILYMQRLRSVDKISLNLLALILFETDQNFYKKNLYSFSLWQDPELDHPYPTYLIKFIVRVVLSISPSIWA